MTLVNVPQVNPNDEVTADSVNKGANAVAAVVNGNIDDTNVSGLSGTKLAAGTVPASAMTADANPETRMSETLGNSIASGCVWSVLTGLNGAMTSGIAYVQGKRLTVSAVASYTFTASRDTYVYVTNTGAVSYNAQTNGAAQPSTPSTSVLVAKVVTSGSAITSIVMSQGRPVSADKLDLRYSTSEQFAGEYWLDGKPIYVKTVNFGSLPNSTSKNVAHGITTIENIVEIYGAAKSGSDTFLQVSMGGSAGFTLGVVGANISIATTSDRAAFSAYITIKYTKV